MSYGAGLSGISGLVFAFGLALAPPPASAQGWRALRIDGSNPDAFQASVASLQNALPTRRREDFETALAVIWFNNTTAPDIDEDGEFKLADVSELTAVSADLLAEIRRGDFVVAIEELDEDGGAYTAADYFEQLDGFGYDEVLHLAGLFGGTPEEGQALSAYKAQILCRDMSLPLRAKYCDAYMRSSAAPSRPPPPGTTGKALSTAIEALKAGDTAAAESAVEGLDPNHMTPFELGMAEALQYSIAYRQRLYPKAREHLQAAVDAGVVSKAFQESVVAFIAHLEQMSAPDGPFISSPLPGSQDPTSKLEQ